MDTLELVLLRHGESEGNRDRRFGGHGPARLTELGHRQAAAAALAIHQGGRLPVDAIYASDLPRTVETAEPLVVATGVAAIVTPELRERSVGEMTGRSFAEVQTESPELWAALLKRDPSWCPPGGESHQMCARRLGGFLDQLLARHARGRLVLVSHGVAIDHLLRRFLGVADESLSRFIFHVDNCSIHRVARRADGMFRILAINDTAHLATVGVGDG